MSPLRQVASCSLYCTGLLVVYAWQFIIMSWSRPDCLTQPESKYAQMSSEIVRIAINCVRYSWRDIYSYHGGESELWPYTPHRAKLHVHVSEGYIIFQTWPLYEMPPWSELLRCYDSIRTLITCAIYRYYFNMFLYTC